MTTGHRMSRADAGVQTTSKNEQGRVVCRGYLMLCVEKEETQEGRESKFKYQMANFGGKVQILEADGKFWRQMAFFGTTRLLRTDDTSQQRGIHSKVKT